MRYFALVERAFNLLLSDVWSLVFLSVVFIACLVYKIMQFNLLLVGMMCFIFLGVIQGRVLWFDVKLGFLSFLDAVGSGYFIYFASWFSVLLFYFLFISLINGVHYAQIACCTYVIGVCLSGLFVLS